MLTRLSIRNIVLIDRCEIEPGPGLCVLTGETGAGKSILLDALGLALGARVGGALLRRGEAQGEVIAEFDIAGNDAARRALAELELEPDDTLIIRRSLSDDGKSRALINDTPVTATALKRIGETLVEIHGQHDQRALQDSAEHRAMLDAFGQLAPARERTAKRYAAWREAAAALAQLVAEAEQAAREQDYLRHMRHELAELAPEPGEEETLAAKRTAMMQSEKYGAVLAEAAAELAAGRGVVSQLRAAERTLSRSPLAQNDALSAALAALDRAALEAGEAEEALDKASRELAFSPEALERAEERLFALRAAGRKYQVPVDELAQLAAQVEGKLALIDTQSQRQRTLEKETLAAKDAFIAEAKSLSAARAKAAAKLEKTVAAELAPLKMDGTRFRVATLPLAEEQWSAWGMDLVRFECATNVSKGAKDVAYAPLSKIASGGELSRFMLALKVSLSGTRSATTLIFDEIDAGTGGAVADAIGARLAALGKQAQVLVVTHLPQVAARGAQHLRVSKAEKAKQVTTRVEALAAEARREELARMLAGATITAEARKAAQKLLEQAA